MSGHDTAPGRPGSRGWLEAVLARARQGAAQTTPTSEVGHFFRQEIIDLEAQLASFPVAAPSEGRKQ